MAGGVGPVVKWYDAAFALLKREFDSRRVHQQILLRKIRSI